MPEGPINPEKLVIDRAEFARVMGVWTTHVARLLKPSVDADPAAAARHIRRCNRAFVGAVWGETDNRFLQEYAAEFAKALEEATIDESIVAKLNPKAHSERQKAQKPRPVAKPRREILRARLPEDGGDR